MKLKMIVIASLMNLAMNSYAQQEQPNAPAEDNHLEQPKVFTGKVISWVSNQDYFYDGFFLQTENEKYLVKFSPRLGIRLNSALKIGTRTSLDAMEVSPNGEKKVIQLVNIIADGMNISDTSATANTTTPVKEPIFGSGTIVQMQENELGQIKGLILFDKTILRFPLMAAEQLKKMAVVGTFVSYKGSQMLRKGEYAPVYYTIVQCKTISIDEKQFLVE